MFTANQALETTNAYIKRTNDEMNEVARRHVEEICQEIQRFSSNNEQKFILWNTINMAFVDKVAEILRTEGEYVVTINGDQMTISWDPNDKIQPKGTDSDPAFPEGWDAARIARWEQTAAERQKFGPDSN